MQDGAKYNENKISINSKHKKTMSNAVPILGI